MKARTLLIVSLLLWLLLAIARQVFDLIGKLWIPVFFNLLQILSNISGLFAVFQYRVFLLVFLIFSSFLSLFYNIFIILWYNNLFKTIEESFLSAGLPYSHSFFVRFTPLCSSHFNLTSSKWVQSECVLPYYRIESLQCIFHSFLALIVIVLSAIVLRTSMNLRKARNAKKCPTITIEFPNQSRLSNDSKANGTYVTTFGQRRNVKFNGDRPVGSYVQQSRRISNSKQKMRNKMNDFSAHFTDGSKEVEKGGYKLKEDELVKNAMSRSGSSRSFNAGRQQHNSINEQLSELSTFHNRQAMLRGSGTNLMSLISFDPKSNTLIRVQKHVEEESDDDVYDDSIPEQVLVQNLASADRGVPYHKPSSSSLSHINNGSNVGSHYSISNNFRNFKMDRNIKQQIVHQSEPRSMSNSFPVINNNSLLV